MNNCIIFKADIAIESEQTIKVLNNNDIQKCQITPALPTALSINESDCSIAGKPEAEALLSFGSYIVGMYSKDNVYFEISLELTFN